MAIHGAVRTDKLKATYSGGIFDAVADVDLDNGSIATLGNLKEGHRNLFEAIAPAAATDKIYLIASRELVYESDKGLLDFYNVAGERIRLYQLFVDDIFTVTDEVISGATIKNQFVSVEAGSFRLKATATAPTEGIVGKVIDKETVYGRPASVIKIESIN